MGYLIIVAAFGEGYLTIVVALRKVYLTMFPLQRPELKGRLQVAG